MKLLVFSVLAVVLAVWAAAGAPGGDRPSGKPKSPIIPEKGGSVLRYADPREASPRRGPFPHRRFFLETADTVVFTGQTDTVRALQHGYLEALLAVHYASAKPRFRTMAWEGDTVYEQWRDLAFGSWNDQLRSVDATVVFANFGQMESLEGAAKIPAFIQAYGKLLDQFGTKTQRLVLLSPRPFEKPPSPHIPDHRKRNREVWDYVAAIRLLAFKRGLVFVDQFTPLSKGSGGLPLTSNGIHLTPEGQSVVARIIARQLPVKLYPEKELQPLLEAIVQRNRLWFDNWRPMNWSFAFGDRTTQAFGQPAGKRPALRLELEEFIRLVRQADGRIHALAQAAARREVPHD